MHLSLVVMMLFFLAGVSYAEELTIGLIPEQNVFKQAERYKLLGEYIEKKAGIKIKFTILPRYGNIIDRFKADKMDGAFFGSFTGAMAIETSGVEPIARPVNLDGTSTYKGYIFVKKDSGIKNTADMKGKRLVLVEKATTAGYIFPMAYFKRHGINIDAYFKEHYFAGTHDAAINAVLEGKADVGCAKHSMFDRMARNDPGIKNKLAIIAESPEVPSNGLCVRKNLNAEIKKRLKDVLLGMDKDAEGKETLKKFEAIKFVPTTKEDYRPVFDIVKSAGIDIKTYRYINK
ncbi:MAG: phosphate/phosphite/phosphonate ABC transporter substrate-binding protein [Nitrospiraceae bacterium]|nr:MAG: phosphate/phosphite/phosphonate ABC transporter substrate-binding protein [Nitrospiraceae bacterium]